jgi:hypothetical protein
MDDFMVGPQCDEMSEEEFERGKRRLLELFDDAAQLDEDLVEIMASWKEDDNDKSPMYTKYGYIVEGKSPSTKILGVPANEDTSHDYD